jgi:ABC-type branched-subunit amino acid transport system ATPase component
VQQGLSHVPEGREVFPLLSVHDNLLMGAYTRHDRDGVARDMEAVFAYFPILKERADQDAGSALRRPAADAGHIARADGQPGSNLAR